MAGSLKQFVLANNMNMWILSLQRISVHVRSKPNLLSSSKYLVKQFINRGFDYRPINPRPSIKMLVGLVPLVGLPSVLAEDKPCTQANNSSLNSGDQQPKEDEVEKIKENDGWKRLQAVFVQDEFGSLSKELNASIQGTWMGFLIGILYGGISQSKQALQDFMERNQASIYENHLDAKRRLQNHVTIHFAKGAWKWGCKLALFTGGFMLFLTSTAAYRGEAKVIDYVISGSLVGAILRLRLGPPGAVVGAVTGATLGLFCGLMTQSLLSFNNSNLDEVLAFQHEIEKSRRRIYDEAVSKHNEKGLLSADLVEIMKAKENIKGKEF